VSLMQTWLMKTIHNMKNMMNQELQYQIQFEHPMNLKNNELICD
jgi:hypothetical protein